MYTNLELRESLREAILDAQDVDVRVESLTALSELRTRLLGVELQIANMDEIQDDLLESCYDLLSEIDHELELRRLEGCYE